MQKRVLGRSGLVGQLAYEGKGGPELAYRFEWLGI